MKTFLTSTRMYVLSSYREHCHCTGLVSFKHLLSFETHSVHPVIFKSNDTLLGTLNTPVCTAVKLCQPTVVTVLTMQADLTIFPDHLTAKVPFSLKTQAIFV